MTTQVTGTGINFNGSTSGTILLTQPAIAGTGTLTLPTGTDTLVGKATTDTLTNKTVATAAQVNNSTGLSSTAYADRVGVQQVVFTQTVTGASGSTLLPWDNSIPQNTEGDQYMTATITPKSATSKLKITVSLNIWSASADVSGFALFQDSTANALAANYFYEPNASNGGSGTLIYVMTSGTTSSTTFKVRAGPNGAHAIYFNSHSGNTLYGGVIASSILIEEIGV